VLQNWNHLSQEVIEADSVRSGERNKRYDSSHDEDDSDSDGTVRMNQLIAVLLPFMLACAAVPS